MDQLFALIASIHPLSPGLMRTLPDMLFREELPKKTLLLREGTVSSRLYFIEKGLLRAFYYKKDRDITDWFMQENDLILSVHSFFLQKPSFENIELLEDATLISISYQDLQELYKWYPEFNFIGRVLTERYYLRSDERLISLRRQTAQERYQNLLAANPDLFSRAPLKHVASYLGMTPETLSRMRGKEK